MKGNHQLRMINPIPPDGYLLIIGGMKCGTTSLYQYLSGHPEICPASEKEPGYFAENFGRMGDYHELWDFDPERHAYAMEASTGYSKHPSVSGVPRRIRDQGIEPRFVYIVRDPFDRIESHYNFMQKDLSWNLGITDEHLICTSNYFLQLQQYEGLFPSEKILVLDFDDLREDPARILQKVCSFLGVSADYLPDSFEIQNPTKPRTGLERKLERSWARSFLTLAPKPLKRAFRSFLRRSLPASKRLLTTREREYVRSRLEEDMGKLADRYDIDVGKWGFRSY